MSDKKRRVLTITGVVLLVVLICFVIIGDNTGDGTDKTGDEFNILDGTPGEKTEFFIGTIVEETPDYIIVEPNEDEIERKSADRIQVQHDEGLDEEFYYGIGQKVLIEYDGNIRETYPAQVMAESISDTGYDEFELSVIKNSGDNKSKKEIISNSQTDVKAEVEYKLYYYGIEDVECTVDGKTMPLIDALTSGKVSLFGMRKKADKDAREGVCNKREANDGGSTLWEYENYTIIKLNTIGEPSLKDMYIAPSGTSLEEVKNS